MNLVTDNDNINHNMNKSNPSPNINYPNYHHLPRDVSNLYKSNNIGDDPLVVRRIWNVVEVDEDKDVDMTVVSTPSEISESIEYTTRNFT